MSPLTRGLHLEKDVGQAVGDADKSPRSSVRRDRLTVTIAMSNYNQARYLPESLGGIFGQNRPADKVLVIDDGSTDNSVDVIREWQAKHKNLRLIRNPTNIGLQASIRRIMPLIATDCLVWAASDDVLLPAFLEKSMRLLERHPDAGLCFSELTVLKGDSGVRQPFALEPSVAYIYDFSDLPSYMPPAAVHARMKRSYFAPSGNTVVVRRAALLACGGFPAALEWHSDWFAFNVVAARFGACVVPETLALIRQREDSYSASGMRGAHIQRPVVAAMLDRIESDDFADIRRIFRNGPSYYSIWGMMIIPLMARRPRMWSTMFRYTLWKIHNFKRGNRLSWPGTFVRIAARLLRSIAYRLGVRIPMSFFGLHRRQELNRLRDERDEIADKCGRLSERYDAMSAELEHAVQERKQAEESLKHDRLVFGERLEAALVEKRELEMRLKDARGDLIAAAPNEPEPVIPSILITTMPKSATYYLSSLFTKGLGLSDMILSNQYFPYDTIYQPKLRRLVLGNRVSQDHFGASEFNVELISRLTDRIIVHLRDPRQALLSYVHYLDDERFREKEDETLLFIYPRLPDDFYELPLARRIDWGIENWLPLLIEWVRGWVDASQSGRLNVKFTRFEDFVADEGAFVDSVLEFFAIPKESFRTQEIERTTEVHFRKGETDEWQTIFTRKQKKAADRLIPADLADRFEWSKGS